MKQRSYIFVYNGRFLEYDSLIELKSEVQDVDWNIILSQTIDCYAQLKAASQYTQLDKNDSRMMRQLKRTLDFIRTIDAAMMLKFDINSIILNYATMAATEIAKKPPPPDTAMTVSSLD